LIIMRLFCKTILVLIVLLSFESCWYSFSDKPFPEIETLGVIPLENDTPEYDLASQATDNLTSRLAGSSSYKLASPDAADALVSGRIVSYNRRVNTYDEAEDPIDYIVKIQARVKFIQRSSDKQLWEQVFEGYAVFPIGGDENDAKSEAVEMLTDRIYNKIKSG